MSSDAGPVVVRQDGVLGGRPTFRGTRVQAEILFENLAEGYNIDEIVESFPTLDRKDIQAAILEAGRMIMNAAPGVSAAPHADLGAQETVVRARLP